VDRKALPPPERPSSAAAYVAPHTPLEQAVAEIYAEILGLERIGRHDNFFDLGGNSLLAVSLHNRLHAQLGRPFSLVDIFQFPTVTSLARYLSQGQSEPENFKKIDTHKIKLKNSRNKHNRHILLE
jgi:acyl carrier protein